MTDDRLKRIRNEALRLGGQRLWQEVSGMTNEQAEIVLARKRRETSGQVVTHTTLSTLAAMRGRLESKGKGGN